MRRWWIKYVLLRVWVCLSLTVTVGIQTESQHRSRQWQRHSSESWAWQRLDGAVNVFSLRTGSDAQSSANLRHTGINKYTCRLKMTETGRQTKIWLCYMQLSFLLVDRIILFFDSTYLHKLTLNISNLTSSTCADLQAAWIQIMAWRRKPSATEAWLLVSDLFRLPWRINRERCKTKTHLITWQRKLSYRLIKTHQLKDLFKKSLKLI